MYRYFNIEMSVFLFYILCFSCRVVRFILVFLICLLVILFEVENGWELCYLWAVYGAFFTLLFLRFLYICVVGLFRLG